MEDAHAAVLDLQGPDGSKNAGKEGRISFFGVYDGHGGETIALYSGENLHNILAKQPAFEAGNYAQALKDGFLATDRAILKGDTPQFYTPALITPYTGISISLYCACY